MCKSMYCSYVISEGCGGGGGWVGPSIYAVLLFSWKNLATSQHMNISQRHFKGAKKDSNGLRISIALIFNFKRNKCTGEPYITISIISKY